jgi:hypothetical protein
MRGDLLEACGSRRCDSFDGRLAQGSVGREDLCLKLVVLRVRKYGFLRK